MKKGLAMLFGTFDIIHPGHLWFLKRASRYGRIVVVLTPDKMCLHYKGRVPCRAYQERKRSLEKICYVYEVVPSDMRPGSFGVVETIKPSVIVLGYDQGLLKSCLIRRLRQLNLSPALITLGPYRQRLYKSSRLRLLAENTSSYAIM